MTQTGEKIYKYTSISKCACSQRGVTLVYDACKILDAADTSDKSKRPQPNHSSCLSVPPPFEWQSDSDPLARYPKFKKKIIQSSFKLLQKVLLSSIPNEEFVFCVDVAVLPNGWRHRRLFYIASFFGAQLAECLTISLFWIYRVKATRYQIY